MKPGRKWVILGALAVLLIVLGVIVVAFFEPKDTREAKARRLIAELRGPSAFRAWLIELGVVQVSEPRDPYEVAQELASLGQPAVPVCLRTLRDPDSRVRGCAAQALGQMDPVPRQAVPALIQALKDKDEDSDVRSKAAAALGGIGHAAAAGMPALIEALRDPDWMVRYNAATVLGDIGGDPQAANQASPALIRALIQALKDEEKYVRCEAARALGKVGASAKAAIPALREALKDKDEDVRKAAAEALAKIKEPAARSQEPGKEQTP